MLCFFAWCGVLASKQTWKDVRVFSKLGGTLLGSIRRPCVDDTVQAYMVLRDIQDQASKLLSHRDQAASRFLALFVGQKRLTCAEFPFIDQLDVEEGQQVLLTLNGAMRIDVMWDEDESCASLAKRRLRQIGYSTMITTHRHRDGTASTSLSIKVDANPVTNFNPLEFEGFNGLVPRVTCIVTSQTRLFGMDKFRHVQRIKCLAHLQEVDFEALAWIKTLRDLSLHLEHPLDANVATMRNLRTLCVTMHVNSNIPVELGDLMNLEELALHGTFVNDIPSQLCKLSRLASLDLSNTNLVGEVPNELSRLALLKRLDLSGTKVSNGLHGWLPWSIIRDRVNEQLPHLYSNKECDNRWWRQLEKTNYD